MSGENFRSASETKQRLIKLQSSFVEMAFDKENEKKRLHRSFRFTASFFSQTFIQENAHL